MCEPRGIYTGTARDTVGLAPTAELRKHWSNSRKKLQTKVLRCSRQIGHCSCTRARRGVASHADKTLKYYCTHTPLSAYVKRGSWNEHI